MRIAVLGTGVVGKTLAGALQGVGHDVVMGTRHPSTGSGWDGPVARFADAVVGADLVVNATSGQASLSVLQAVGADALSGIVVLDVSNPLDFSQGMPPALSVTGRDSLGEQLQRAAPGARVVKALNTVNADVMVSPSLVPGDHVLPIAGEESGKVVVIELLGQLGWPADRVLDLGAIEAARAMASYLPLWVALMGALGTPHFNLILARS